MLGQLQQLDSSLGRAVEQYNLANVKLARIRTQLKENRFELRLAKRNLKSSQRVIATRLVTLYTTEQTSTIEVILGARSLDDMINRMDGAKSVTSLDARVLGQVEHFRTAVRTNGRKLAAAHAEQRRLVAERAARKGQIESQIGQQRTLLSSIKGQIAQMEAAQAARQRQLAAAAESRLAAQQRAAQQQAAATVVGVSATVVDAPAPATAADPTAAPSTPAAPTTVVAPPSSHGGVVGIALSQLGTRYVWAGSAPGGFDCSGLVMWAYGQVGVSLPHSTYAQYGAGVAVSRDQLQPGDLVFFDGLGHVGIYIGGGQFVHAPHTGDVVKISSLGESWYSSTYVGARRIL